MSLLNDMLKDLDNRSGKEDPKQSSIPRQLRPGYAQEKRSSTSFMIGFLSVIAVSAALLFWVRGFNPPESQISVSKTVEKEKEKEKEEAAQILSTLQSRVIPAGSGASNEKVAEQSSASAPAKKIALTKNIELSNKVEQNIEPSEEAKSKKSDTPKKLESAVVSAALITQPDVKPQKPSEPRKSKQTKNNAGESSRYVSPSQDPLAISARIKNKAVSIYEAGDYSAAERLMTDYLAERNDVEALGLLTSWHTEQGFPNKALVMLNHVDSGSEAGLRYVKAQSLSITGDVEGALSLLRKNLPTASTSPDYFALLAALYQKAGRYDEAVPVYAELVNVSSERGDWWAGLAIALEQSGRRSTALQAYRQSLRLDNTPAALKEYAAQRLRALLAESKAALVAEEG